MAIGLKKKLEYDALSESETVSVSRHVYLHSLRPDGQDW